MEQCSFRRWAKSFQKPMDAKQKFRTHVNINGLRPFTGNALPSSFFRWYCSASVSVAHPVFVPLPSFHLPGLRHLHTLSGTRAEEQILPFAVSCLLSQQLWRLGMSHFLHYVSHSLITTHSLYLALPLIPSLLREFSLPCTCFNHLWHLVQSLKRSKISSSLLCCVLFLVCLSLSKSSFPVNLVFLAW